MQALSQIDYAAPAWELLSAEQKRSVKNWLDAFSNVPTKNVTRWLVDLAEAMGCEYPTARRKYDAIVRRQESWAALIDKRTIPRAAENIDGTSSLAFRAYLVKLVSSYQRNNTAAFRELRRRWDKRETIPGYEQFPGWPNLPTGWHKRNLARIVNAETSRERLNSIRIGTSSKTNLSLPTTRTTRVGLWPGAVIQLDDVWHDNYVSIGSGRNLKIVRVLELGALDLFSAHRFHWGAKPRCKGPDNKWQSLNGGDMRLFTAGMLHSNGYSSRGTMLMSEHATANVSEAVARILYDASGGLIRVDYQPIEGKQAALNGYWSGTEGGNFRAKACLESTHNLIHNDLAHLAMQTGSPSSGLKGPVTTERIKSYIEKIVKDVLTKVPHRAELLQLRAAGMPLDFHTQFVPYLMDYYHFGLACRTDHQLEGWSELGHQITEYTTCPGSGHWLSQKQFLALPPAAQSIIAASVQHAPQEWMQRRNLSPYEVYQTRSDFKNLPPSAICEIIGQDLAREVTASRGFLEFCDAEISADSLIYKSRYIAGPNRGQEIQHGQKVLMFAMPFDNATAFAVDAAGRYLGELPLYRKVNAINPDAFQTVSPFDERPQLKSEEFLRAAGEKHARIADTLEPDRINHREEVQAARDLRAHNRDVIQGRPITPDEIATARSESGKQGHRTAAANRLQAHGNPFDSESSYQPDEEIRCAWDALPDDIDLPDAF